MYNNSPKRFIDDYIYFVTVKTENNYPFFRNRILCELWIEELKLVKELKQFELFGFCLLCDHFHLLIKPKNVNANISEIMRSFKTNFSRNANFVLGYHNVGDVTSRRLLFEKNNLLGHFNTLLNLRKHDYATVPTKYKFKWQKSFHDHIIRNTEDLENHYNYTINNFIKHNLSESWEYTSINFPNLINSFD